MAKPTFEIPSFIRKYENLHIVFWLLKDMSWCMGWKTLALVMIFPTLCVAFMVLLYLWNKKTERYHNLAVLSWIIANSYWMSTELFQFDKIISPLGGYTFEQLAIIPFASGLMLILGYHLSRLFNSKNPT
jgi:hypothetical protein